MDREEKLCIMAAILADENKKIDGSSWLAAVKAAVAIEEKVKEELYIAKKTEPIAKRSKWRRVEPLI